MTLKHRPQSKRIADHFNLRMFSIDTDLSGVNAFLPQYFGFLDAARELVIS